MPDWPALFSHDLLILVVEYVFNSSEFNQTKHYGKLLYIPLMDILGWQLNDCGCCH